MLYSFKCFEQCICYTQQLIVNIGLKTLLQQGISEPIFYGDLVYKFKRIVGKPNFSDKFKKTIVKRYILKQKSNVRFSWYCIYQSS